MLYKIENNYNNLIILGHIFVINNRNKGKLIINNKKNAINEFINTDFIILNEIKLKLLLIKNISNKSCFFRDCKSLLKLSLPNKLEKVGGNIIKYKDDKENGNYIDIYPEENNENFYEDYDEQVKYPHLNISEIYKTEKKSGIDTILYYINNLPIFPSNNIYLNFREMFYNCSSLNSISDIFKYYNDRYKILDMSYMFYNCLSLKSLPDITALNTEKVIDMSSLFNNCSSITTLPDYWPKI